MSDKSKPVSSKDIKSTFQNCYDLSAREILLGGAEGKIKATVCYIDGLVSGVTVADTIIRPATTKERFAFAELESEAIELILKGGVYSYTAILRTKLDEVVDDMLNGFCAVIFDTAGAAVTFEVRSPDKRSIDEPKEEKVVKGAKDVFIEIMRTN
ncbi:MAG: spore germination protein, partial [Oscillospiraceae bacterium]|nr:spore germination protein [Oscillospiraceae bacterium]